MANVKVATARGTGMGITATRASGIVGEALGGHEVYGSVAA